MNKVAVIIISVILAMVVGLSGCLFIQPKPASPQLGEPPWSSSWEVIQCPSEVHMGDYITVNLRVPEEAYGEFTLQLLETCKDGGDNESYTLGKTIPDSNSIVSWYVALPTESMCYGQKHLEPGSHMLYIWGPQWLCEEAGPYEEGKAMLTRNIIIKE